MRPLYDARIGDLGPGDLLKITCQACSHVMRVQRDYLARFHRMEPYQPVLSLQRRFSCRRCRTRGHVDISIQWAPRPNTVDS